MMIEPKWTDGTVIGGVVIVEKAWEPAFILDFDLKPPVHRNEFPTASFVAAVHEKYQFLPDEPSMVREADLIGIEACHEYAEAKIKAAGYPFLESTEKDLISALACICFNDEPF